MAGKEQKTGIGLSFALNGIAYVIKQEQNMRIHMVAAILAIICGVVLQISKVEWVLITVVIALVMVTEVINSCIELMMDYIKPDYHVLTKHIKDMAAGAVLLAAIAAAITGFIIFLPKLLDILT
ncbi:diacylglycerol kinase family protein [Lentibacillus saliphilus]|uniref:diacylglycerol kinase family protein n=1 Tax=Lentibacillus saliphilus TaxID=2737028 RepID=UPI001C2F1F05|nr:diacylglycerol kinase family protein [Lentibacillus saliphilus]